jgi:hypothetical protein
MRLHALVLAGLWILTACGAPEAPPPSAEAIDAAKKGEVRGFVFTYWGNEIPHEDPGECPDGMNVSENEFLSEEYAAVSAEVKRRYEAGDREGALSLLPPDACKDPTVRPDPGHKTLDGPATVAGIDLDGVHSQLASGGSCAHDDFVGPGGVQGIDNQYWRLMGCVKGYRPDGLFDRLFDTRSSITENGYSVLLETTLVEGTREIKGGVLTAGPVDLKLRFKVQAIDNHYWFRDAQIRAEMLPDGGIKGVLAGYWDIASLFDFLTEVYIGPVHLGRAAANNIGYMCSGVYHALPRLADGHPDPETGQCTTLSTTIEFAAVPAFVIPQQQLARSD